MLDYMYPAAASLTASSSSWSTFDRSSSNIHTFSLNKERIKYWSKSVAVIALSQAFFIASYLIQFMHLHLFIYLTDMLTHNVLMRVSRSTKVHHCIQFTCIQHPAKWISYIHLVNNAPMHAAMAVTAVPTTDVYARVYASVIDFFSLFAACKQYTVFLCANSEETTVSSSSAVQALEVWWLRGFMKNIIKIVWKRV